MGGVVRDPVIEIDAAGRTVRVSNPERVIFPATDGTAPVTKLQVIEYYLAVAPGIMRALHDRPTTLERWPKGVHPGMVLSRRDKGGGDAFYQKRVPRGAPPYVETARIRFPSGRFADEIWPTSIAPTSCGSTSIRSRARTSRPGRAAAVDGSAGGPVDPGRCLRGWCAHELPLPQPMGALPVGALHVGPRRALPLRRSQPRRPRTIASPRSAVAAAADERR